ncbi:hypothetical protein SMD44_00986 [Streptomyces alboflavus]|uniref:Uncharacterized protein n=1 Tax=Streptomyces alboflavus TaxID=67267 RepID=A0A1Z1W580_9ACTN|nr:helix-turn-helix domain-containing protein [Streptomyces alboflavus]ARX81588.1 hypothetical protein SMD44_00986 [Streptomyces alboflavus]
MHRIEAAHADHTPSRACYMQGCTSPDCELANYRYMCALRLDHSRGVHRLRDAAPAFEHLQRLLANDWTVRQISEASGVSMSTVRCVLNGKPLIRRDRAAAVLGIPIGPPPPDPDVVDSAGSVRRLRALACLGHTLDAIGAQTGVSRWRLGRIITGTRPTIDSATADKITQVYRHLSTFRSDNPHTIRRARNEGWHGPLAWDDIDNPDCKPETATGRERPGLARPDVDPRRVVHLAGEGLSAAQIAERLGCHKRTVVRARRKAEELAAAA